MTFIETVTDDSASDEATKLFAADRARLGYVANYTRLFAQRPNVEEARRQLLVAISQNMDPRRYELATVAAAHKLRSSYCSLAHGKILSEDHFTPEIVRDLIVDRGAAALDDVDRAVMDLAEKVADDATTVSQGDIDRLRELGPFGRRNPRRRARGRCPLLRLQDARCAVRRAGFRLRRARTGPARDADRK